MHTIAIRCESVCSAQEVGQIWGAAKNRLYINYVTLTVRSDTVARSLRINTWVLPTPTW